MFLLALSCRRLSRGQGGWQLHSLRKPASKIRTVYADDITMAVASCDMYGTGRDDQLKEIIDGRGLKKSSCSA